MKEEEERGGGGDTHTHRQKNSSVLLSYVGIKFQPKGTENDLRKTELHPKTQIRSPSLWGWILPPGETLVTYKVHQSKKVPLFLQSADRTLCLVPFRKLMLARPPQRILYVPYLKTTPTLTPRKDLR